MIEIPERAAGFRLWRYMTFGRFVWMLHRKALWLSRVDQFGDQWEAAPSARQMEQLAIGLGKEDFPGQKFPNASGVVSGELLRLMVGRSAYVSCWTHSDHESHAMWNLYCHTREGVAIQTTARALRDSLPDYIEVLPVTYSDEYPVTRSLGGILQLVTQKRPMFSYEREIRVVWLDGLKEDVRSLTEQWENEFPKDEKPLSRLVDWNPAEHVDAIRIHPEADESFIDAVMRTVDILAPELKSVVQRSEMAATPSATYLSLIKTITGSSLT